MPYNYTNDRGEGIMAYPTQVGPGMRITTSALGCILPDDEIPNLISALQDYMSRRAKELTRAANESR